MSPEVRDNTERSRFEAWMDGEFAGYADYTREEGRVVYPHTEVRIGYEGRGVGGALARAALEDAGRRGVRAVVTCPFIASWLARNPEFQHLAEVPS
ncbi:GNAT family N-acetyltransferase [Streptomyces sp. DSM 44915]|uniref:GNAT family N-acetyltransferase n=1 Tax=Streptomyces chisholmiae TaxID=3075540 RepID=A0ABU2JXQ1_9ACTN|nr:GNAT family N-acetyltransferase [Streptomyces sp. DSM 44915]MDT0269776.1 GNAT family N-acetyltransferase [Streptomyces sp. DSM 44915]